MDGRDEALCENKLHLFLNNMLLFRNTRHLLGNNIFSLLGNKTFPAWEWNIPTLGIKDMLLVERPFTIRETASYW